jgi:penicillin-binding protein 2
MTSQRKNDKDRQKSLTRRAAVMGGVQVALLGGLGARMYYLQVVSAGRYKVMADQNRINVRLISPQRGRILDRFGVTLAANQRNYRIVIVAEQAADIPSTLDAIGLLVPLNQPQKNRVIRDIARRHAFVPVVVLENLTWDQVARIEVNMVDLPGVSIDVGSNRFYPYADKISHVVGYVAPVSEDELNGDPLLELPDFRIGKSGIEKDQDLVMRGAAGTSEIEVNALGRVVREIARDEGQAGQEVALTIDMALQDYTMRRIADQESVAVVVMDAITGEVLVMASSPAYDDNAFTHGISADLWRDLNNDPHTPLNNKAIQGVYPPGSTFKPVTGMAALSNGIITPDFKVTCTGQMKLGDAVFHCWSKYGHGTLDLHGGYKHSCDIYFYEVARRVGIDKIAETAHKLGLGQPTGIDIPNERPGLIPTTEWKKKRYGISWQTGETFNAGIGQGYIGVTPLQLATMLSRLVTNKQIVPHLVRPAGVMKPDGASPPPAMTDDKHDAASRGIAPQPDDSDVDTGNPDASMQPVDAGDGDQPDSGGGGVYGDFAELGFDPAHLAAVLSGMDAVVNEQGGTAYAARIVDPDMAMGGKSGTAQVKHITMAEREHGLRKPEDVPWAERDHGLFIAFAPVQAPRYVTAIVIEHGIGGSKYAAPIARDLLTECQKRDPARKVPADPAAIIPYEPPPPDTKATTTALNRNGIGNAVPGTAQPARPAPAAFDPGDLETGD